MQPEVINLFLGVSFHLANVFSGTDVCFNLGGCSFDISSGTEHEDPLYLFKHSLFPKRMD